jgi:hypothetical protein
MDICLAAFCMVETVLAWLRAQLSNRAVMVVGGCTDVNWLWCPYISVWRRDVGSISIGKAPVFPGFVCLGAGRAIAVHGFLFCRVAVDAFLGGMSAGRALFACWKVAWMVSSGVGLGVDATSEVFSCANILRVSDLLALVTLSPVGELVVAVDLALCGEVWGSVVGERLVGLEGRVEDPRSIYSGHPASLAPIYIPTSPPR